jgi:hypothetical protein
MLNIFANHRLILGAVLGLYLAFGSYHLGKFITTDEHFWFYERIPGYWDALTEGRWKKTAINDKPGISVAFISGAGLVGSDPLLHRERAVEETRDGLFTLYRTDMTEQLYTSFRFPILAVNGLLLILLFFAWREFLGEKIPALLATAGTALSPILLGMSRVVNPDALLWSSGIVTVVTFLAWLKTGRFRWIAAGTGALAMALLSKYTANTLVPFLFVLLVTYPFLVGEQTEKDDFGRYFRRSLIGWFGMWVVSAVIFALFLPASFIKPSLLWEGTFGFLHLHHTLIPLVVVSGGLFIGASFRPQWFPRFAARCVLKRSLLARSAIVAIIAFAYILPFTASLGDQPIIPVDTAYHSAKEDGTLTFPTFADVPRFVFPLFALATGLYSFLFSLSPLVLFGSLFAWFLAFRGKLLAREWWIVVCFSLFTLAFIAMNLISGVLPNARYSILLYPLFAAIAAIGWWRTYQIAFTLSGKEHLGQQLIPLIPIVFLSLSSFILFRSFPFPLNYTSPFLDRQYTAHDGWGYGQYEAAQYLNGLPGADQLVIWSDRNGICAFLRGPKCLSGYRIDTTQAQPSYFVLSKRGEERNYIARDRATEVPLFEYTSAVPRAIWRLDILDRPANYIVIVPAD